MKYNVHYNSIISSSIPTNVSIKGWESISIEECGERLVLLNDLNGRIKCDGVQKARESVARRLELATSYLPDDCELYIRSAHRSIEEQKKLFENQYCKNKSENPNLSESELIELTQKYVIKPTVSPFAPPPHSTGGAIDLTIRYNENKIEMGTVSGEYVPQDETAYYEKHSVTNELTFFGIQGLINRRILYNSMIAAGFTNNPDEWWHFDYGDQFWAKIKGTTAIYGMIE